MMTHRANDFQEIRKLGTTDKGLTYLDQFRQLITEIGIEHPLPVPLCLPLIAERLVLLLR